MKLPGLSHIGDVLAVPFFLWLSIYFYQINNKTMTEYILMSFVISGFIMDLLFTYLYFRKRGV
jgi:hypothetical protein